MAKGCVPEELWQSSELKDKEKTTQTHIPTFPLPFFNIMSLLRVSIMQSIGEKHRQDKVMLPYSRGWQFSPGDI